MKDLFVIDDHRTENISSLLRWFFLIICVPLFYYRPISDVLSFNKETFPLLFTVGFIYMAATQIVLFRFPEKSLYYRFFTRGGIVFDFIVYIWLVQLTGASQSPFLPVSYLMVIHAAIYWRLKGSFIMAFLVYAVLLALFISDGGYTETETFFSFFISTAFLWLIALYGGVIASKERQYYFEKNMYQLQSEQDYLTGLYNHRKFQEDVLERTKTGTAFTLVLCDIDHFKKVNDVHGHVIGDEVLKLVAAAFTRHLSTKEGTAYRYGGEEFAWIVNTDQEAVVLNIIEHVNSQMERYPFTLQSGELPVTLSYGITVFQNGEKPAELIQRADNLLYEAKADGRNTVKYKNSQLKETS